MDKLAGKIWQLVYPSLRWQTKGREIMDLATIQMQWWLPVVSTIFMLVVTYIYGECKKSQGRKESKKENVGRLMTKMDLIVGQHYKIEGIAPCDGGREEPRFAFALVEGIKNPGDKVAQKFGVDLAFSEISINKKTLRAKAGDTIAVTAEGTIVVIPPQAPL